MAADTTRHDTKEIRQMDMRKYSGAAFINIDDVRERPLQMQIAVVREGKYEEPDLVFESGEAFTVNSTNNRTLMRAYESNSDNWIGKEIELALGKVKFQGELQDAVIVKPISPTIAAAAEKKAATKAEDDFGDDHIPF
jgi:hypothetical protein